jgi:xanthosine utilization system XapX-like protein
MLSQSEMMKLGMALGILYAAYKFIPHPAAKAAVLGVAGVVVGKNVPIIKDVM